VVEILEGGEEKESKREKNTEGPGERESAREGEGEGERGRERDRGGERGREVGAHDGARDILASEVCDRIVGGEGATYMNIARESATEGGKGGG